MNKASPNLQDSFLNQLRKNRSEINVYLVSGFVIKGFVKAFDTYTIMLEGNGDQHLIYKHGVASIGLGVTEPQRIEEN